MTYLKIIDLKPVPGSLIDDFKCSGSAALLMKGRVLFPNYYSGR
jgi:hypothetical protein